MGDSYPNKFKKCYAVKSEANRPVFSNSMTPEERAIMNAHSAFWDKLPLEGKALVTGLIQDPNKTYGFGIVFADDEDATRELLKDDPAQELPMYHYSPMFASFISE